MIDIQQTLEINELRKKLGEQSSIIEKLQKENEEVRVVYVNYNLILLSFDKYIEKD